MQVLLIDDHPLFREGLRVLIERMDPKACVVETESCEEAIALAERGGAGFDLILLDLALPGMNGLEWPTPYEASLRTSLRYCDMCRMASFGLPSSCCNRARL